MDTLDQFDMKGRYLVMDNEELVIAYNTLLVMDLQVIVPKASRYLITELEAIIPDETNFFRNFTIFHFDHFVRMNKMELLDYGNKEIQALINYYLSDLPKYRNTDIVYEWRKLKTKVVQLIKDNELSKQDVIKYIFTNDYFEKM